MRNLFLLTISLIGSFSFSQCDKITNVFDDMKNIRTISSPHKNNFSAFTGTIKKNYQIEASKVIRDDVSTMFIIFTGYGSTSLIGSKGLYVKLSNGEIIRLEDNKIESSYLSKGIYYYTSILQIDESNIDLFSNNDIIQFDMSIYKFSPKDKDDKLLKEYIKCIYSIKD